LPKAQRFGWHNHLATVVFAHEFEQVFRILTVRLLAHHLRTVPHPFAVEPDAITIIKKLEVNVRVIGPIGEALGLDIKNVSADGTTITVTEKAYHGEVQDFLKTKNGNRVVDLAPEVGKLLREYIGKRKGLVFATRNGKPLSQSNVLRRQLHPLLAKLGIAECGFHALRRYRTTHLRNQRTPEALVQFWLGHAGKTITDSYDRSREDATYRKEVATSVGVGFTIPTLVVQNSVESSKETEVEVKSEPVASL
jgi:integrase